MIRMTKSAIKELVTTGAAIDISHYDFDTMNEFMHSHVLQNVAVSSGTYGMNGGLLRDVETNQLYAITTRNSTLFMAF